MTAISTTLIRWHYLWYVTGALAVTVAVITSQDLWALNFLHVFCGLLWTGIDLFMGFILGPILRVVDIPACREVLLRLTPRTLFLMPTLSIITATTGWYLAKDMGFNAMPFPQYAWIAASLALVTLMSIQGIGYLLPKNFQVCLELQKENPDNVKITRLTHHYLCRSHTGDHADCDHHHHGAASHRNLRPTFSCSRGEKTLSYWTSGDE